MRQMPPYAEGFRAAALIVETANQDLVFNQAVLT